MNSESLNQLPVGLVLWVVTYCADYYLTIYGRRLWLENGQPYFNFQGSYELNPYYQQDIDSGRWLSKRFLVMLALGVLWMVFVWGATRYLGTPDLFALGVGYLVMLEVVVISSHVQNIRLFSLAPLVGAVEGHISYARWVSLDATAWKFGYWGAVLVVLAVATASWFFTGGAVACLYNFVRYRRYAQHMRFHPVPDTAIS